MIPEYFDVHSHPTASQYDSDREEVLKKMVEVRVATIVVGTSLKDSQDAVNLANEYVGVYACIGVHPEDDKTAVFDEKEFAALVVHPKVVAIGECGLDYFRLEGEATVEKKRQKDLFVQQIEFAIEHNKPLMLHIRGAYEDSLDILEEYAKKYGEKLSGNAHFFAGGLDIAKRLLAINFSLSFTGVITFTRGYDEVIRYAPLNMIMSETDAPYVTPVPYRGQRNTPAYVQYVAEKIAEIRGEEKETVRKALVENALMRFKIES